jgi:hypothetical protein
MAYDYGRPALAADAPAKRPNSVASPKETPLL